MNVLFLAQRVPYPPNRGDKITTWRIVERFARDHRVTVIAFAHDDDDLEAARVLREDKGIETIAIPHDERRKKLLAAPLLLTRKPLTLGVFGSRALQREVDARLAETDVAYAYSSSMGAFLVGRGVPWIMHFAELDSDKWRQYADEHGFPMSAVYRREWRTLRAFEERIATDARTNVFCTPLEERIFREAIPGRPSVVVRNGVDLEHFHPAPEARVPGRCVFTGVMDYFPNAQGCVWFADEILPRVRERAPDATFTIIGSRPTDEVRQLGAQPGIEVTGFVDDVREHAWQGSVSVAPLRVARGIQNKVLEALALGLPTVGTTSATQGVEGTPGEHFRVADDAEAFARDVADLLTDGDAARDLGARGRAFALERYDWERCLAPLDQVLDEAARGTSTRP